MGKILQKFSTPKNPEMSRATISAGNDMANEPDSDFQIKNPVIEHRLKEIGRDISAKLPKGWGFALHLFEFGENGSTFYIAKAERADMVRYFREWLQKQGIEAGTDETAANIIAGLIDHATRNFASPVLAQASWDAVMEKAMMYLMRAKTEHPDSAKEFWARLREDGLVV